MTTRRLFIHAVLSAAALAAIAPLRPTLAVDVDRWYWIGGAGDFLTASNWYEGTLASPPAPAGLPIRAIACVIR